jgi:hypothetical protein
MRRGKESRGMLMSECRGVQQNDVTHQKDEDVRPAQGKKSIKKKKKNLLLKK